MTDDRDIGYEPLREDLLAPFLVGLVIGMTTGLIFGVQIGLNGGTLF